LEAAFEFDPALKTSRIKGNDLCEEG